MANYTVNLWGSEPGTNDDCWTGEDFETKEAALATYQDPWGVGGYDQSYYAPKGDECWIEVDGPNIHEERCIQKATRKLRDDDDDWKREIANQAGLAFGCDGYNDAWGY